MAVAVRHHAASARFNKTSRVGITVSLLLRLLWRGNTGRVIRASLVALTAFLVECSLHRSLENKKIKRENLPGSRRKLKDESLRSRTRIAMSYYEDLPIISGEKERQETL